jgi:hypothetical protein
MGCLAAAPCAACCLTEICILAERHLGVGWSGDEAMRALWERIPSWLSVAIGVAAIAVGFSLAFKPFSSLGALTLLVAASLIVAGAGELVGGRPGPR